MSHQLPSPFLSIDERIQYLYAREYVQSGCVTPDSAQRLARMNFHYFLGYARNYRLIAGDTNLVGHKDIVDIFQIIDMDHRMSDLLFSALRSSEHLLRSALVEKYCDAGLNPYKSFLDPATYQDFGGTVTPEALTFSIADQILRYREPYVIKHLESKAKELGVKVPDRSQGSLVAFRILEDLPIWAIIDCLQLGTLSRMITTVNSADDRWLWQKVAGELGIPSRIFHTNLTALSTFRNQVAHFGRLWMKPTADTPKKPRAFEKRLRQFSPDSKSMLLNFYNVGLFLPAEASRQLLDQVDAILAHPENRLYRLGVTNPTLRNI